MKISEMDSRQRRAYRNAYYAAREHIGGLENAMLDSAEGSEDYESAAAELKNHEQLVNVIYDMTITDIYEEGCVRFGSQVASMLKDIRFCGKEWIMERIEIQVSKLGY